MKVMKSPITGKEMIVTLEKDILIFRKEKFEYLHKSYYCKDSNEHFTTKELDEFNLNQVYNQYRDKHNVPFPDEIIEFRNSYSFSYTDISKILGFGTNSYRNYEKGEVPSLANAALIKTVMNSFGALKSLIKSNNEITDKQREKFVKNIEKIQATYKENRRETAVIEMFFDYNFLPDNFSGYKKPNFSKLSEMIVFFSENIAPTVTKMNKLLFYADFLCYKLTGNSISGTRYLAHNYGPVPSRFRSIFDHLTHHNSIKLYPIEYESYVGEAFTKSPHRSFNKDVFKQIELEVLEEVSQKFKLHSTKEIMNLSHEESAWIENEKTKSLIDYRYSFKLKHI